MTLSDATGCERDDTLRENLQNGAIDTRTSYESQMRLERVDMLFVELALTVVAWRRGWGARALCPIAIGRLLAVAITLLMASTGGAIDSVPPPTLLGELFAIIGLVGMIVRFPERGRIPGMPAAAGQSAPAHAPPSVSRSRSTPHGPVY